MNINKNTNYNIFIDEILKDNPRTYFGVKIIFVVHGEISLCINDEEIIMHKSDLLVINRGESYHILGEKGNCVITLEISGSFFAMKYPNFFKYDYKCFSRDVEAGKKSVVDTLRSNLSEMIISKLTANENHLMELENNLYNIMLLLTNYFKTIRTYDNHENISNEKILKVIQDIEQNYADTLSLSEMSKMVYYSPSYLSRYFKKTTGVDFTHFIINVRLKHAIEDLCYTDEPITKIALKNGFSSDKYFNQVFKDHFDMTPNKYRIEFKKKEKLKDELDYTEKQNLSMAEILLLLSKYCSQSPISFKNNNDPLDTYLIDSLTSKPSKLSHPLNILFCGDLSDLMRKNIQDQILLAKKEIDVDMVGIKNIFSKSSFIYRNYTDEDDTRFSPYDNADTSIEFLIRNNINPFFIIEFNDFRNDVEGYLELLKKFLIHSVQAFGNSYISNWKFIYYYEESDFHRKYSQSDIYLKILNTIKDISPKIEVGTFINLYENSKIPDNQAWYFNNSERIDFFAYKSNQNENVDFSKVLDDFNIPEYYHVDRNKKLRSLLSEHGIDKPLYLINWNTLTGETHFVNGTYFRGALIMDALINISPHVDGLGFWINTEVHERGLEKGKININGMELFHYSKGKRPAYYALLFKKRLQGQIVSRDKNYLLTQTDEGYQLVLMNCSPINPQLSVEDFFLQKRSKEFYVQITGLKEGEYQIKKIKFDRKNGALYPKYGQFSSKYGIDSEMRDYIIRSSEPFMKLQDEIIGDEWSFYDYLDFNAIHFFELKLCNRKPTY